MFRQLIRIIGCAIAGATTGCSTPALHPAYSTDVITQDAGVAGTWVCEGEIRLEAVVVERSGPRYDVDLTAWHRGEEKTRLQLDLRLLRLDARLYGDLFLAPTARSELVGRYGVLAIPVHQVVRYAREGETIEVRMLESSWLNRTLAGAAQNTPHQRVPTDEGEMLVLTASTGELQRFIEQHADEPTAFGAPFVFRRASP